MTDEERKLLIAAARATAEIGRWGACDPRTLGYLNEAIGAFASKEVERLAGPER